MAVTAFGAIVPNEKLVGPGFKEGRYYQHEIIELDDENSIIALCFAETDRNGGYVKFKPPSDSEVGPFQLKIAEIQGGYISTIGTYCVGL